MNEDKIKELLALSDQYALAKIGKTNTDLDSEEFNKIKFKRFKELFKDEWHKYCSELCEVQPMSGDAFSSFRDISDWQRTPDRMGGQFTQDEINNSGKWI